MAAMATFKSAILEEVDSDMKPSQQSDQSEEHRVSPFMKLLGPELHHSLILRQSLDHGKYSKLADEIYNSTTTEEEEMKTWLLRSLDFEPKLRFQLAQKLQESLGTLRKDLPISFHEELDEDPIAANWIQSANEYVQVPLQGKFPVKNSGKGHCGFCCVSQVLTGKYSKICMLY